MSSGPSFNPIQSTAQEYALDISKESVYSGLLEEIESDESIRDLLTDQQRQELEDYQEREKPRRPQKARLSSSYLQFNRPVRVIKKDMIKTAEDIQAERIKSMEEQAKKIPEMARAGAEEYKIRLAENIREMQL